MGSAKDAAVKGYIRLPQAVRRHTDGLVRNRGKAQRFHRRRSEEGKQILKQKLRTVLAGKRRRRK